MTKQQEQKRMNRRSALTAAGMGMLALGLSHEAAAQTAALTAQERANIKIVEDFLAAWNAKDGAKVMSYFAEDARFSNGAPGNTRPWSKPNFEGFITGAKRLKMTVTPGTIWARGPVVTLERTDDIETAQGSTGPSGRFIAVYTVRDGKIVDFLDFLSARPPYTN